MHVRRRQKRKEAVSKLHVHFWSDITSERISGRKGARKHLTLHFLMMACLCTFLKRTNHVERKLKLSANEKNSREVYSNVVNI